MRLRRTAAKALAGALVASAALTATAHATTNTVGPTDLVTTGGSITAGAGVVLNTEYPGGGAVEVPEKAKIEVWSGNFDCTDGCGEVRLVQLRATPDPDAFDVIDTSTWEAPTGGVETMSADFTAEQHDLLALEGRNGGKVLISPIAGGRTFTSPLALSGNTFTRQATSTGTMALYNADFIPLLATETSLTGAPNPVNVSGSVTLTAAVSAAGVETFDPTPDPTGTVAFTQGGTPIAGCGTVPLVNGTASCPTTAPMYSGNPSYEAAYSGDSIYAGSDDDTHVRVRDISTTVASVAPNPVPRLAPITYTAEISGAAPVGGEVTALQSLNNGTVAFSVDGVPIADCATRPVSNELVATCQTLAPPVAGTHTLTANYAGGSALSPSSADKDFVVLAPAVTLPETVDFASVKPGESSTRTVVLTNSGGANLAVGAASITAGDAYSITADACSDVTLEPGAGCSVQVAFHPSAAGAYAGTLAFSDDAGEGTHSTALTGTGVAVPAPPTPTPPAPTATPTPTPQPGATLAPGAKPTLTVTPAPASNPNAAPTLTLPLSCPANEECQLDGTLKIDTSALSKSVRAAAVDTTTVARFSKVQIAQGKLRTIKLKLSPSFIKSAQKRGIRRIKATLTINTVLGSGQRITTRQQVTVLIPKAAKRKVAAPKAQPKFTG